MSTQTWTPFPNDRVVWTGHDGTWVVDGHEDDDHVWVYRPGTRMVPVVARPGQTVLRETAPERVDMAPICELKPVTPHQITLVDDNGELYDEPHTCEISEDHWFTGELRSDPDAKGWFWGSGGCIDKIPPAERVVTGGIHYAIGDEKQRGMRGFGGRRHDIEWFDGRKVTTTNLWCQGVIPDEWRERHPDNARLAKLDEQPAGGER